MPDLANTLMTLIGSLGFPIVCCFYLIKVNENQEKQHKEAIEKLESAIKETKLTVEANTKVVEMFSNLVKNFMESNKS